MRSSVYSMLLLLGSLFTNTILYAQSNGVTESTMRSNGKIYVVVAILVFILTGLFLYLIRLDRKISRLEKNN